MDHQTCGWRCSLTLMDTFSSGLAFIVSSYDCKQRHFSPKLTLNLLSASNAEQNDIHSVCHDDEKEEK